VNQGMLILTGGPGTGKTTTVRGIIALMKSRGMHVALAAPTGRAAIVCLRLKIRTVQQSRHLFTTEKTSWMWMR